MIRIYATVTYEVEIDVSDSDAYSQEHIENLATTYVDSGDYNDVEISIDERENIDQLLKEQAADDELDRRRGK